jgi:hypothetical protein
MGMPKNEANHIKSWKIGQKFMGTFRQTNLLPIRQKAVPVLLCYDYLELF